ncbi:MAG: DEAD/DEAH box helicase [Akkermansiaceae bacterium]
MKNFSDLGLSEELVRAVTDKGYTTPSPIQAQAIPAVLKRRDLIAAAQTGTGKTAGFTLPIIQILDETSDKKLSRGRPIRSLILTPTRELAAQIHDNVRTYGANTNIRSAVVFGGVKIGPQIKQLRDGVDILVATPGRLLDLCEQKACKLENINILVLDEADRMLDMGFINDIRKVIKMLPRKRQNLLFSATFSKDIRAMTRELLVDPITIEISPENSTANTVTQSAYRCDQESKSSIITKLIKEGKWEQVLIFTRTKHGANRLCTLLEKNGINSSAIHGNKSQGARTKALAGFKDKTVKVLVATDIAARGIDISELPHVINYELPNIPEDYVHRIGRTGRAGKEGEAISLVSNDERPFFTAIEKLISKKIPLQVVEGFEPQLWTDRAPTASEVQKIAARKKEAARQARGPRKPSAQGGRNSRQGGKNAGANDSRPSGRPARANSGNRTRRSGNR